MRNLDDEPTLRGMNSTTEALPRFVADRLTDTIATGDLGPSAAGLAGIKVTLRESPVAWASYERNL
jgi:hypothetical protein